jgi:uncharacterized Zn-binding protein involved in type VI secretion
MGQPAAKLGDAVVGVDVHLIKPPGPLPPVPLPNPFTGKITGGVSSNVSINGKKAATVGSSVENSPKHQPIGGSFVVPPTNTGTVVKGSTIVKINGKPAARAGDRVLTCNDPAPAPTSTIVAVSNVLIGG